MTFFRFINKRALLLWSLLLSLSLLCAQGAELHVHNLDRGHEHGHAHLSKAHFIHDDHHDTFHDTLHNSGVISELDISPDGAVKNTNHFFAIVVVIFLLILMIFSPARRLAGRCRGSEFIFWGRYDLSPPLRAPPPY